MKTVGLSISEAAQLAVDTGCKIRRMDWDPKAYIFLEEGSGEFLWHDCETFVPTYESLCGDDWEIVSERKKMSFLAAIVFWRSLYNRDSTLFRRNACCFLTPLLQRCPIRKMDRERSRRALCSK